jgi:hypothetical protein
MTTRRELLFVVGAGVLTAPPGGFARPTRFELIIHGKTAKAMGFKISQSLLMSDDKVIE